MRRSEGASKGSSALLLYFKWFALPKRSEGSSALLRNASARFGSSNKAGPNLLRSASAALREFELRASLLREGASERSSVSRFTSIVRTPGAQRRKFRFTSNFEMVRTKPAFACAKAMLAQEQSYASSSSR